LTEATSNLGVAAFADWARLKEAFTMPTIAGTAIAKIPACVRSTILANLSSIPMRLDMISVAIKIYRIPSKFGTIDSLTGDWIWPG
jgi:hypothetical protein